MDGDAIPALGTRDTPAWRSRIPDVVGPVQRQIVRLCEHYRDVGFVATAFAASRHLADRVLSEPAATRYRYRSELLQRALVPAADPSMSLLDRLAIAWLGFDERLYHAYGFDQGTDPSPYLSEYGRKCATSVNRAPELLHNKETFHVTFEDRGLACHLPTLFGVIDDGTFRSRGRGGSDLRTLLHREERLVIKEVVGGGGAGVYLLELGADGATVRGPEPGDLDLATLCSRVDRSIVTSFCKQAPYLDRIAPWASNTVRIMTMRTTDGEVFIPAAAHRFGARGTGGTDNFSRGGLSALVDLETGHLSAAARLGDGHRVRWHPTHPDTGAAIEGVEVPGWPAIRQGVLAIARTFPELAYVGWDVLVEAPGRFVVVEGNHYPDPDLIQVHRPLLADRRARRFFEAHDLPT